MAESKNLIAALILSICIMFVWQYYYVAPRAEQAKKYEEYQKKLQKEQASKVELTETVKEEKKPVLEDKVASMAEVNQQMASGKRVKILSPALHGSILLDGLRFDDITLADYKETTSQDSPEVRLLAKKNSEQQYFAEFGWIGSDVKLPDSKSVWHADKDTLQPGSPVIFIWDNKQGLKFFTTVSLDENYMFSIEQSVENYGRDSVSLFPSGIINRIQNNDHKSFFILHEGALGVFDGILNETRYSDIKEKKKIDFSNAVGWLGITDKYWLTALIPDQKNSFNAKYQYYYRDGHDGFQVDYMGQKVEIASGEKTKIDSHFFVGPKKVKMLDKYGKDLGLELFDRAVDFGWLYFVTKPIFHLMEFYYHLLGNFGLAILLLTVTLKLLLYPLANKSYVSMHQLKRFQPQIMEIKERYKDDKVQLQKEIMALYQREKVNPMSGCLPLLIQIPVFFSLYKVLFVTIEMRHAPFYGWITDLSASDPTSLFNLFGLLPWGGAIYGFALGAWPIIMGITMMLQQKMNPQPADPVQAKVMKMLPFMFIFIFATFPAGLIIYWAWNNTLSIAQQWVITRRLPKV